MQYRELGRTGWKVSTVSFGAWAIGGAWGAVDDKESLAALDRAIDLRREFHRYGRRVWRWTQRAIGGRVASPASAKTIYVATKAGRRLIHAYDRRLQPREFDGVCRAQSEESGTEAIDLLQLHCPPNEVYYRPEVFGVLEDLVAAGKLRYYGVSVKSPEEGLKAMDYPNLQSVQIIFNMFRHRPAELFFAEAQAATVGVLARVPLASGMLTGKMRARYVVRSDRPSRIQSPWREVRCGRNVFRR